MYTILDEYRMDDMTGESGDGGCTLYCLRPAKQAHIVPLLLSPLLGSLVLFVLKK